MGSTTAFPSDPAVFRSSAVSWGSIFAGTFVFLAIEVTFGLLGLALFGAANPGAVHPVAGMSFGIGIWTVVLSIIALYFAGRTASRLSGTSTGNIGMYHGLVTYGMCIFATVIIAAMTLGSTIAANANATNVSNNYLINAVSTGGWWIFFACLLGMIAAVVGGSQGLRRELRTPATTIDRERLPHAA